MSKQPTTKTQAPQEPKRSDVLKRAFVLPVGTGYRSADDRDIATGDLFERLEESGALDDFAAELIALREQFCLDDESDMDFGERVFNELGFLLERAFQRSEAYRLAFAVFAGRLHLSGGQRLEDLLTAALQSAPTLYKPAEPVESQESRDRAAYHASQRDTEPRRPPAKKAKRKTAKA